MNKYDVVDSNSSPTLQPKVINIQPLLSPPPNNDTVPYRSIINVIICELCESLTFYSVLSSLPLYLTRVVQVTTDDADYYVNMLTAVAFVVPLFGGWLADSYLGRYRTTLVFLLMYCTGAVMVSYSTFVFDAGDTQSSGSATLLAIALLILAVGNGSIKPNLPTIGADQCHAAQCTQRVIDRYFSYYYMSVNVGSVVSFTLIAYLCQSVSFTLGFAIPAVSVCIGTAVFYAGRTKYVSVAPPGSVLNTLCGVLYTSWTRRHSKQQARTELLRDHCDDSVATASNQYSECAAHFTDTAKLTNGGTYPDEQVEDVRSVLRILPFVLLSVPYWLSYQQMNSTWYNQACQMNVNVGGGQIPVVLLNIFDALIIVICMPLFDNFIYPFVENVLHVQCTTLRKIGCGFCVMTMAMASAAVVEMLRMQRVSHGAFVGHSICTLDHGDGSSMAVDMSIMWQIPQFTLVGLSEVLASGTAMELFYTQAPSSMKSLCSALQSCTTALGCLAAALLVSLVNSVGHKWITHDANHGYLDRFYWLLTVLMAVNTVAFVYVAGKFQYRTADDSATSTPKASSEITLA